MPVITVQLGQCGNQLGAAWFDTLAAELGSGAYGSAAADTFFQQWEDAARPWAARAVLVDMEPKVIHAAKQRAAASKHGWRYAAGCSAAGQSGSGNNWALGHNTLGPAMAPTVLELVRKQVEACDTCDGLVMLQSMAGGTGAGAGSLLAEALADAYGSTHLLNCCIWPYESGEVTVQPYNSLLSMASLAELSSGILLLQNEQLHATCSRLLGIKAPGFQDLNRVAARGLASTFLPSRARPAAPGSSSSGGGASSSSAAAALDSSGSQAPTAQQLPLSPVSDLTCHLFAHPAFRVAGVRCMPQLPAASIDFTTFAWAPQLSRMKAMAMAGVYLDENLSGYLASGARGRLPAHKYKNRAVSAALLLRGKEASSVLVQEFEDPGCYAGWAVDPLLVAAHASKFGGCPMTATLLTTDQSCVAPLRGMLSRGYAMAAAGAYLHQYQAHGLGAGDLSGAFAVIEDLLGAYAGLG